MDAEFCVEIKGAVASKLYYGISLQRSLSM